MENRFNNNAVCDIYIGKGAGKNIRESLKRAKEKVTIISPFFSGSKIMEDISFLLENNVKISIVTKENGSLHSFFENFVTQKTYFHRNRKFFVNLLNLILLLTDLLILVFALEVVFELFFDMSVLNKYFNLQSLGLTGYTLFLAPFALIVFRILATMLKKKIKIKSYDYVVHENISLHILNEDFQLHSKIYIIDDAVAYLGSLNFTDSGFQYNHETRIKTADRYVIANLNGVYEDLLMQPSIDISVVGYRLYELRNLEEE